MDKKEVRSLIERYEQGLLNEEEERRLESWIETGRLDLNDFPELHALHQSVENSGTPEMSEKSDLGFYDMIARAIKQQKRNKFSGLLDKIFMVKENYSLPWVYSVLLLATGAALGWWLKPTTVDNEITNLSQEVREMKEMMMLSLLEGESISDRLKAVNLSHEIPEGSGRVVEALFRTLNGDDNVNVRLAALDAVAFYTDDPVVRRRLVESIGMQESPLMQMAMAEWMVALQEKSALHELRQILKSDDTPLEVKKKIKESIEVLI